MKKITLTLLFAMATLVGFSQVEVALGLKAGPNFAKINTDDGAFATYKGRTGFHGGAFALFKFTKIGIQPELIFSQQGSTLEFDDKDYKANISYLNIPVMLKLYLAAGLNLQLGPQFGFLMKAKQEFPNLLTGETEEEDIKDELKGSDLSLGMGAGWDLPFGLTIDARYNLGLSKINDGADSEEAKNQVFQVSLGYKIFKLGK